MPSPRPKNAQPSMATNRTSGRALSGNVLEDVVAAVSKGLALVNFGQIAQLRGHWTYRASSSIPGKKLYFQCQSNHIEDDELLSGPKLMLYFSPFICRNPHE
jgi:hypothetical protein